MAVGLAAACGGKGAMSSGTGGDGTAGGAGATGSAGAVGTAGGAGAAPDPGADCVQAPAPARSSGTIVELPLELVFAGQPFVYGEANTVAGSTVIPTDFRFYVSQVALRDAADATIPVDIVTPTGALQPYGVFLFNAESADAQTVRVLAPPGSYTGLTFAVGLTPACNRGRPEGRGYPLSSDAQMTWPVGLGYLFLRYESVIRSDGGASVTVPLAIHMGADLADVSKSSAIVVRVDGALSVPATGSARKVLRVAMDQIFHGATSDPSGATNEIIAGELLRVNGSGLPLFTFGP